MFTCPSDNTSSAWANAESLHRSRHKKRMAQLNGPGQFNGGAAAAGDELFPLRAQPVGDSTLNALQAEMTSGTGSGMPFLASRTFAKEGRRRIGDSILKTPWGANY